MKIKFSPQRNDDKVKYIVSGDMLTLEMNGEVNVVDFSNLPNGVMEDCPSPIISAKKVEGEIFVELLTPYGDNAPKEVLFPPSEYQEMTGVIYETIEEGVFEDEGI